MKLRVLKGHVQTFRPDSPGSAAGMAGIASRAAGYGEAVYVSCAGIQQGRRAGVQGGAAGGDIVHDQDAPAPHQLRLRTESAATFFRRCSADQVDLRAGLRGRRSPAGR
jgi:hypothetical protein